MCVYERRPKASDREEWTRGGNRTGSTCSVRVGRRGRGEEGGRTRGALADGEDRGTVVCCQLLDPPARPFLRQGPRETQMSVERFEM